jgi:hypothetical protein
VARRRPHGSTRAGLEEIPRRGPRAALPGGTAAQWACAVAIAAATAGCGGTRGRLIARPRPRRQRPPARAGPFRQGPGVTMPAPARGSVRTSAQRQSRHRRNAATRPLRRPLGRQRTQAGMGRGGGAFRDGRAVHAAGQKTNISRTIASPIRRTIRYRDDDDGIRRAARRRWRGLRWSWPRRTAGTRLRVIRHAP